MKKHIAITISVLVGIIFLAFTTACNKDKSPRKTIEIDSSDGVTTTADVYESEGKTDPIILLFHQAGYSRGEYREIAPLLQKQGFTCISIDQRSGKTVNGVDNKTHLQAIEKGLGTEYTDAYPDLEATLKYAKKNYPNRKIIVWGSSYSSSLVLILGAKNKTDISGIISFSPGEYFKFEDKKIAEYAKEIDCPVYITSAKNETEYWKQIFENVQNPEKQSFIPKNKGIHGSKALWETTENNEEYWNSINEFLNQMKK